MNDMSARLKSRRTAFENIKTKQSSTVGKCLLSFFMHCLWSLFFLRVGRRIVLNPTLLQQEHPPPFFYPWLSRPRFNASETRGWERTENSEQILIISIYHLHRISYDYIWSAFHRSEKQRHIDVYKCLWEK